MTKHLRLIMLSLLAMICLGGYSAVGDTYKLVTSVNDLYNGDVIVIANSQYNKAMGMQNTNNRASVDISFTDDSKESFNLVAKVAVLTLKKTDDKWQFHSTHGYLYSPGKSNKNQLKSSEDGTLKGSFATITFKDKNAVIKFDCNNSNLIEYNSANKLFNCYESGQQPVQIYKKQNSNLTPTNTTFGTDYDGKTFNFVDGKLEGWNAPTATHTPAEVGGNFSYESDKQDVVTVDENGQLTFNGYGTAKITATFTPTETEKYAKSSASYTVINKEGERTPTAITFGVGVDNNTFEVKDGESIETRVATFSPVEATGSIVYTSSDEAIAKVDAATGAITLGAKYGTAVITAKFVATGSFANSEASYSIKHVGDFVFYESFDKCDGTGGNDDKFSGSIASSTWKDDRLDEVWTKSGNVYLGNKCIRIGKNVSSVTTSSIEYTGKSILTFKAAAWSTEDTKVKLTITGGTLKYGESEPTTSVSFNPTKGEWQTFEMEVTSTGPFTLQFANETTSYRFFLDEVMIKKVKEASPKEITLDENSDNIVEAAENANVTLKRKLIADDNWNTLCVPFNLTPEQTTKAFGADVELRTLTHAEGTTLTFGKATEIEAGKPYLIRVKEVPTDYVYKFTGVKVIASSDNWTIQDVGNVNFIGLYAPRDVTELEMLIDGGVALFLGDNNKFFRAQSGTKMGGFRAFFLVSKDTNPTNVKAVIDGVANGIEDLVIDGVKANGRVYNLNGQYVGKSLNGLQPGLYIQNGKKIVIK